MRRLIPIILIVWLAGMTAYVYLIVQAPPPPVTQPLSHTHVKLQIFINYAERMGLIPGGIGVDRDKTTDWLAEYGRPGVAVIHTESDDGILHIEPTREGVLTMNDFFRIWGQRFDVFCIDLDQLYCMDNYQNATETFLTARFQIEIIPSPVLSPNGETQVIDRLVPFFELPPSVDDVSQTSTVRINILVCGITAFDCRQNS